MSGVSGSGWFDFGGELNRGTIGSFASSCSELGSFDGVGANFFFVWLACYASQVGVVLFLCAVPNGRVVSQSCLPIPQVCVG